MMRFDRTQEEIVKATRILSILAAFLVATGCGGPKPLPFDPTPIPTLAPATLPPEATVAPQPATAAPEGMATTEPSLMEPFEGLALPADREALFSASGACAICHTRMVDEAGADVSIDTYWRATMMANAARDPYWQATVREEVVTLPGYRDVIEDTCAKCHTPMARVTVATAGGASALLDAGFLDGDHEYHALAIDGVSCTLCHQIKADNLGKEESFSGGYVIDVELPPNERVNYGPFRVGQAQAGVMQVASGFIPVQGEHVGRSELCAVCHTLYTPYVDASGEIAGMFPEQTPYLEWQHSDYGDSQACQDCHMPAAQGGVQLSTTGGPPRSPFGQHVFVGGNAYVLRMFRTKGPEQDVTASSQHFEAKIEQVEAQLQARTATVTVEEAALSGSQLAAVVAVESQVGHKFPSGFPSRRVWLHLAVADGDGRVVFESGGVGPGGAIAGNDNDADPAAYEPHYEAITAADQVQVYEAILQNTEGEVTTALLKANGYVKDNRLLPAGFDKQAAAADVAVHGAAAADGDFAGGGDRVRYEVDLGEAGGPFVVTVELLYQSIGYRWAQNVGRHEGPEIERFLEYYEAVPNLPVVVARAAVEVGQ
jgi:hypothetical protein